MSTLIALFALLLSYPAFGAEDLGGVPQVVDAVADKQVIDPPSQTLGPPLAPGKNGIEAAADIENQRRFDQLSRELHDRLDKLLEGRDKLVDRWLTFVAIVLTAMGVVAPIVGLIIGFLGFQRFRQIEAAGRRNVAASQKYAEDVQKHAQDAKRFVEEIRGEREKAGELRAQMEKYNAENVRENPDEATRTAASVQRDPTASPIALARADAVLLQRQGKTGEAIEKWRSIANDAEEEDRQIRAQAWFSIGYLLSGGEGADVDDLEVAFDAYTEVVKIINLDPTLDVLIRAYNNRGSVQHALGRHEEAFADYNRALALEPDYAPAYSSRAMVLNALGRHTEALAECGRALAREPDYAPAYYHLGNALAALGRHTEALAEYNRALALDRRPGPAYYHRGNALAVLGRIDEARTDYQQAQKANDENLVAMAKDALRRLDNDEEP